MVLVNGSEHTGGHLVCTGVDQISQTRQPGEKSNKRQPCFMLGLLVFGKRLWQMGVEICEFDEVVVFIIAVLGSGLHWRVQVPGLIQIVHATVEGDPANIAEPIISTEDLVPFLQVSHQLLMVLDVEADARESA